MAGGPDDGVRGAHDSAGDVDGATGAAKAPEPAATAPLARPPVSTQAVTGFTQFGDLLGDRTAAAYAWCEAAPPGAGMRPAVTPPSTRGGMVDHGSAASTTRASGAVSNTDLAAAVSLAWPHVVGEEIAANSQPIRLKQGRLVVAVSSTIWAQSLQFMEQTIAAGLNDRLGSQLVERIAFRHAGWRQPALRAPAQTDEGIADAGQAALTATRGLASVPAEPLHLTPEQEAALHSVEELGLEPQLTARIIAAMRASFVRAQQTSVR